MLKRVDPLLLLVSAILSSASILIVEILAGRMLAPYVGMSVYSWTAIISTVLAGLSIGHWIGGRLSCADADLAYRRLSWIFLAGALLTLSILVLLRPTASAVLSATDSPLIAVLSLSCIVFLPPAIIGGIPAPLITRVAIAIDRANEGPILGRLYAAGALGAILGSLAAGFLLIPYLGSALSIIIAATIQAALFVAWRVRLGRAISTMLILPFAVGGAYLGHVQWGKVCDEESAYFCLRVIGIDNPDPDKAQVRGLVLDHLVHGMNVEGRPEILLSPYLARIHQAVRALHSGPRRAFFVGGGAYTLPRLWSAYLDVTVSEIDPAVTAIAAERLWVDPNRFSVRHQDARIALRQAEDSAYDIIVGDAFKDVAAPFHLITREFAQLAAAKLSADGLYALNLVDRGPDFLAFRAVFATLSDVFPGLVAWRELETAVTSGGRATFVLIARKSPFGATDLMASQMDGWRRVTPDNVHGGLVLTDDHAPLERLLGLYEDTIR